MQLTRWTAGARVPALLYGLLAGRILILVVLGLVGLLVAGCGRTEPGGGSAQGRPPPPQVTVVPATRRMVEEFDEYSARLAAVEQVQVRSRVSGTLEQVHFRDGQFVRKGQQLFTIDPRPFAAEAARNEAAVALARSQARLAQIELVRAESLEPSQAISRQEADQARATAQTAGSTVSAAQAALATARLNLGFTRIAAPIDGRLSRTQVTVGNLVNANDTVLTTLVSTNPVYAYFDASEAAFLKYGQAAADPHNQPAVWMGLFDEQGYPHRGRIDFVDNRLNPDSGSAQMRAVFDNAHGRLTPGLSARLRVVAGKPYEATVVPDRAITTDQTRKLVLVVPANRVVQAREVKLGALVDGMRVVSGVEPGEQVVVEGLQRATPGAPVTPQLAAAPAAPTAGR
jgi:RND family efflux transporter MFP subunit